MSQYSKPATILLLCLFFYQCATVTNPDGGPKDEAPPTLVESTPTNNQVNFTGHKLELTFTELIKLQNPKEQIIIIPPVGKRTQFIAKKNRLEIIPEKELEPNTTYAIKFRNAVQDLTEGNPVPNLNLAFSTGPIIDSLKISGTIKETLSEVVPEGITIALFSADTFNIFKHTPSYFTESDKTGAFTLTNLKPGVYRIYAFKDTNKNLIVESKTEKFGFQPAPINLNSNIKGILINLVNIDSRPLQITSLRQQADLNTIRINKQITNYRINSTANPAHIFGTDQTEILIYHPAQIQDSLAIRFTATDSLNQKIDTLLYTKKGKGDRIKQTFITTPTTPEYLQETTTLSLQIKYNKPILQINLDSILFIQDSTKQNFLETKNIKFDTLAREINITNTLKLNNDPKSKKSLHFGKGYLISIDGDSSKSENKPISPKTIETTGTLLVQIQTKETHYITQVLNSSNKIIAQTTNQPNSTFKYLNPEAIKLRLIIDKNQNGKWDTANYLTNTEPEPIIYYMNTDKSYTTPIRANWEVGPLIIKF
jgi:uncharacterized protein (DUF2141 family)